MTLDLPAISTTLSEVAEAWASVGTEHFGARDRSQVPLLPLSDVMSEARSVPRAGCAGSGRIDSSTSCCVVTHPRQSAGVCYVPSKQRAKQNGPRTLRSREPSGYGEVLKTAEDVPLGSLCARLGVALTPALSC